jgi:hypothetical protein
MPKHGLSQSDCGMSNNAARSQRRRAVRLLRRGEERKALQLLRDNAAREPSGATYCWLAELLLRVGKQSEALHALRQALYGFRYEHSRGRAGTVAAWILSLDPTDAAALKVQARREPLRRAA